MVCTVYRALRYACCSVASYWINTLYLVMQAVRFYKAWDRYGSLSNFSCHSVHLPDEPLSDASAAQQSVAPLRSWQSVEHYYQAQKFASPEGELFYHLAHNHN